ncbi:MAG: DeoR family transcriptional regulator [Chloroflexi bacterium]|nr:DeoR family transcriptional regulator [Chloroflexota bacterium]
MPVSSINREKQILEYLRNNGNASIQQLAEAFGVSNMTIHRDLNRLAENGRVQKKHGGAILVSSVSDERDSTCAMCSKPVSQRTVFIVKFENGEEKRTCCAHCGLMLQSRTHNIWQTLTTDYLYGHMISAGQAYYLTGSDVNICCVPSVLAFSSKQDAEKFQKGFGGQVLSMNDTVHYLHGMMHTHSGV